MPNPSELVEACTPAQREALVDGVCSDDRHFFVDVESPDGFQVRHGALPPQLVELWQTYEDAAIKIDDLISELKKDAG